MPNLAWDVDLVGSFLEASDRYTALARFSTPVGVGDDGGKEHDASCLAR